MSDSDRSLPPIWNLYTKEPEPKKPTPFGRFLQIVIILGLVALAVGILFGGN